MRLSYPIHILEPIHQEKPSKGFRYKPAVAYLLSVLSEVDVALIENCKVYSRSPFRYMPWYNAQKGGGAITLGNKNWQSITFTENFFSDDKSSYAHAAYLNNLYTWLKLSSHEVGHLSHALRFKSLIVYLIVFIIQYVRYGHDDAPLEHEANVGSDNFKAFHSYVYSSENPTVLSKILESDLSEAEKIEEIKLIISKYRTKNTLV